MKTFTSSFPFFLAMLLIFSLANDKILAAPLNEEMRAEWLQANVENGKQTIVIGTSDHPWNAHAILFFGATNLEGLSPDHTWRFSSQILENNSYLSNYYPQPIVVDGRPYKTSEHYYQAIKFPIDSQIYTDVVNAATPAEAKQIAWGNAAQATLGDDQMMSARMKKALWGKFITPEGLPNALGQRLIATGERLIIEGNRRITPEGKNISDQRWGMEFDFSNMPETVSMTGQNLLGNILMELRAILQNTD